MIRWALIGPHVSGPGSSFEYNNHVNIYFGTGRACTYRRRVTTPVFDVAIEDPPFLTLVLH